jgi:hypothetical protein
MPAPTPNDPIPKIGKPSHVVTVRPISPRLVLLYRPDPSQDNSGMRRGRDADRWPVIIALLARTLIPDSGQPGLQSLVPSRNDG